MKKRMILAISIMVILLMSAPVCAEVTSLAGSVWYSEQARERLVFRADACVEWTIGGQRTVWGKYDLNGKQVEMRYYADGELMISSKGTVEEDQIVFPGLSTVFQLVSFMEDDSIDPVAVEENFFENYWHLGYDLETLYEEYIETDDGYVLRFYRDGTAEIVGMIEETDQLEPAQEYYGYRVTRIGYGAFNGNPIASIVIPEGVTSIGGRAFFGCSDLRQVVLPEGLRAIGECAFFACSQLQDITLPKNLVTIGQGAFSSCESIIAIDIPDSVERIEPETFEHCSSLREVRLPADMKSIGDQAFLSCAALESIELPEGLIEIGLAAFALSGLRKIAIPDSVAALKIGAFQYCKNLEKVSIGTGLPDLPQQCFLCCEALRHIEIPAGIQMIGKKAFSRAGLKEAVFNGACRIEDEAFEGCADLECIVAYGDLEYSQACFADSPLLKIVQKERGL